MLAAVALGDAAVTYLVFERYLHGAAAARHLDRVVTMLELLGHGLVTIPQWKYLLPLFPGTLVGVVGGALPGVTITMTIIVLLPFTYGLDPLAGLAAMTGVYVGGSAGGLITALPASAFPARRRRSRPPSTASRWRATASPAARSGSACGPRSSAACSAALFLIFVTGPLAAIALEFGPWEYFSLFVLAMAMVAGLAEASLIKGLISTAIGLLITVIGTDPIGSVPRFTFGSEFIGGGFPFLPVLIGIFAFAQIMTDVEKLGLSGAQATPGRAAQARRLSHLKVIGEILSRPFLLLWSTIVGIIIGVLPAIGGSAPSVMAYDQAKKFSKTPELFGTGHPEGIIASEASNNANVSGSLVTIMAFGIPGDAVTAVMLGAMTIHGIQSGPLFISQHPAARLWHLRRLYPGASADAADLWASARSSILRVTSVRLAVLAPVVLVLCVLGAYALNNTMQSVYVLLIFGVFGYVLVKVGFPLAPLILGLILGDQIEINLIRAIMTDDNPWLFLTRPISGGLLLAAALSVRWPSGSICGIRRVRTRRRSRTLSAAWSPSRSHDREESASAHDPCAADGSVFREGW